MKKERQLFFFLNMIYIYIFINYQKNTKKHFINQYTQTLLKILEIKDSYTQQHCLRVAHYSKEIAKAMKLNKQQQNNIYYIALLHDIGKIGICDDILKKKEKLSEKERNIMQQHVFIGKEISKYFDMIDGLEEGIFFHHERYDGKGYLSQIKGKDIPLVSRIIAVGDAYDAMNSNRCYRLALCQKKIIDELTEGCFHQFDGEIVQYMIEMIQKGEI